jgi:hypothetical protein
MPRRGRKPSPGTTNSVSAAERSGHQKNEAPRSSMAERSMVKNPMKTGIWTTMGRQPATGL